MVGIIIGALAAVGILMFAGIRVDAKVDELESWQAYIEVVCEQKNICPELVQALIAVSYTHLRNTTCYLSKKD